MPSYKGSDDRKVRGYCGVTNPKASPPTVGETEAVRSAITLHANLNDVQSVWVEERRVPDPTNDEHTHTVWTEKNRDRERERSTTSCFGCTQAPNTEHTLSTGQKKSKPTTGHRDGEASGIANTSFGIKGRSSGREWLWAGTKDSAPKINN